LWCRSSFCRRSGRQDEIDSTGAAMNRLSIVLAALAGLLAGALAYSLVVRPDPQTDVAAVRAIVEDMLAEQATTLASLPAPEPAAPPAPSIDAATINPLIESYLLSDPKLLQRMSAALEVQLQAEEQERSAVALADFHERIF